jgi:hypothetical protein
MNVVSCQPEAEMTLGAAAVQMEDGARFRTLETRDIEKHDVIVQTVVLIE